ncbi:hypothetical protein CYMTET_42144 [Cymbomonas tetramitiformis]|uniref:Uncharacterized protein n=1 Tax=Cymbomonas tetramitiformis TaxID=36881 RepID=A0AAE0C4Q4_9CHLO|nr:hypothetical protein CYMTET_42144 [Cymbomonas tetramitiformis]
MQIRDVQGHARSILIQPQSWEVRSLGAESMEAMTDAPVVLQADQAGDAAQMILRLSPEEVRRIRFQDDDDDDDDDEGVNKDHTAADRAGELIRSVPSLCF